MFDELARAIEGEVVVSGSPPYGQLPRPFNARFDDVPRIPDDPALSGGFYVEPTVLVGVRNKMRCAREEIFGPVLVVIPVEDEDDAVAQANRLTIRAWAPRSGRETSPERSASPSARSTGWCG